MQKRQSPIKLIAFTVLAYSINTTALAEVSVNIGYVSDYIDQGISNSNRDPALQAGADYYHDDGWYLGTWLSEVDFQDNDEAKYEWDIYTGYSWTSGSIDWDAGLLRFMYPGADSSLGYDSTEAYVSAGFELGPSYTLLGYTYTPDNFSSGKSHYVEANMDFGLPHDYTMTLHLGRITIEDNITYGTPDYIDWLIGISRSWNNFYTQVALQGTDLNNNECFGGLDWCDSQATLSVIYTY
jgi:uncharacterized protein (TIGR02001 family)